MTRPVNYDMLRDEFKAQRRLRLDFPNGKVLWIVDVTDACDRPAVLIAYEGGGVLRFEFDRPLNLFRLYSAGFPGGPAARVFEILTNLFPPT